MLTMKQILREGNSLLKEVSTDVALPFSQEDQATLEAMIEYIFHSIDEEVAKKYNLRPAVGIAAVQIGILKKMIVIYAHDEKGKEHFYPMVNPKLLSYSDELTYLEGGEGCLSVDRETEGLVHRPARVSLRTYLYKNGKLDLVSLRLTGYMAIVFQHEYDHLNGILFVDRIHPEKPWAIPEQSKPVKFMEQIEEEK